MRQDAEGQFLLGTTTGTIAARALVIATGGLSIPKIGATDFAYRIARQFGHKLIDTRPALVPLTFAPADWEPFAALSGVSLEVQLSTGNTKTGAEFTEDLLLTHRGLSGPGVLQISSYWQPGEPIHINLLPERDAATALIDAKNGTKRQIANLLSEWVPQRLAHGYSGWSRSSQHRPMRWRTRARRVTELSGVANSVSSQRNFYRRRR